MSIQPRIKTKQELYFDDKNNIDNEIIFQLKTYGLKNQRHLLNMSYINPKKIRRRVLENFKYFLSYLGHYHNFHLPDNAYLPYLINFNHKLFNDDNIGFFKKEYARVTRWLDITVEEPELYYLKNYINKNSSINGMNSPRNKINIWVISQIGSPYRTQTEIKKANKEIYNLLQLFGFEYLYPNQKILNQLLERKFEKDIDNKIKLNKEDYLYTAIDTIFNTDFQYLVRDYMYPDMVHLGSNNEYKINHSREKVISKMVGEFLLDKEIDGLYSYDDYAKMGMFLSSLKDKTSNNYMNYIYRLL